MEITSVPARQLLMEFIKKKFGLLSIWEHIEVDIALLCSSLPEPNRPEDVVKYCEGVSEIKQYLLANNITQAELKFLDDEIEAHNNTKLISLYEEKDDRVDPETIEKYARLGEGTEGLISIHQKYNYKQLSRLTNGVFSKTGLIKFYISREKTVYGKIVAEIYEHSQKIPIASLYESKKKDGFDAEKKRIFLFGEPQLDKSLIKIKDINIPFYVYRFITEDNDELILMSPESCEIGDYIVSGVVTECTDYKSLTDSARLPTKLPFFFAQRIMNRIIKFKTHDDFFNRLKQIKISNEDLFNFPFILEKNKVKYILKQPEWYKWLIWSWITHHKKGLVNDYPLHIMQIGPKNSGKSLLLNGLHANSKETRSIFSGSSSTLKSLIPSFKHTPAKIGYLGESNRFSYCDEFLRCLTHTRNDTQVGREEAVALMNDLLEHQKREAGSGVSKVNVNMTARVLATTNPVRGINSVQDMLNTLDESFLSRWLIYYQDEEHIDLIRKSSDDELEIYKANLDVNDWIGFIDYLQSFSAVYDSSKIKKIHEKYSENLSESLLDHYESRHKHHLECLLDGVIKARCFVEKDHSFSAKEIDYERVEVIWSRIIKSWIDAKQIKYIDQSRRIYYMPEKAQFIYRTLVQQKKPTTDRELKDLVQGEIGRQEAIENIILLKDNFLIFEEGDYLRAYYKPEDKETEKQCVL